MTQLLLPSAAFLLLLLLPPATTTAAATTTTTTVLDTDGHPIQAGTNYYILPVIRGRGGGLTMRPINHTSSCPLYVAQDSLEISPGLPLKFFPVDPKQRHVTLSSDLNIVFDAANICVRLTGWRLTLDEDTGRRYVGTGGSVGNPGLETVSNWFKIEKAGGGGGGKSDYKIVFCPGVCSFCKVLCGDIGVLFGEDGRRLLGFTDQPLLVMFKKA